MLRVESVRAFLMTNSRKYRARLRDSLLCDATPSESEIVVERPKDPVDEHPESTEGNLVKPCLHSLLTFNEWTRSRRHSTGRSLQTDVAEEEDEDGGGSAQGADGGQAADLHVNSVSETDSLATPRPADSDHRATPLPGSPSVSIYNRSDAPFPYTWESDILKGFETLSTDLHRTFPRLGLMGNRPRSTQDDNASETDRPMAGVKALPLTPGPEILKRLRNVLEAFAMFRPDIGYVQGMAYVAAMLVLHMEEFDAFVCLSHLMARNSLFSFYTFELPKIEVYFRAFDILLQEKCPRIATKLREAHLNSDIFLVEWMFTLFTRCLPFDLVVRIWDQLLVVGDLVLFQVSLGIMTYFQHILATGTTEECMAILSSSSTEHFDDIDTEKFLETLEGLSVSQEKLNRVLLQATAERERFHAKLGLTRNSSILSPVVELGDVHRHGKKKKQRAPPWQAPDDQADGLVTPPSSGLPAGAARAAGLSAANRKTFFRFGKKRQDI
eukprot:Polyplicarium_translucidae@DN3371_c1_g1_i1.p2